VPGRQWSFLPKQEDWLVYFLLDNQAGLLFLLIFGGFSLIIGAGNGDPKKAQQGQKAITSALIGFAIVFLSYFIIQTIEIFTGLDILNPNL